MWRGDRRKDGVDGGVKIPKMADLKILLGFGLLVGG